MQILNEMMGGPMKYEYCENPPLPPGVQEVKPFLFVLSDIWEWTSGKFSTKKGHNERIEISGI